MSLSLDAWESLNVLFVLKPCLVSVAGESYYLVAKSLEILEKRGIFFSMNAWLKDSTEKIVNTALASRDEYQRGGKSFKEDSALKPHISFPTQY